jgi:hypothetical protein
MNKKNTILICLFIFFSALACQSILPNKPAEPPADVYLGLRNIWFTTKPDELGVEYEPGSTVPYAIVMDIGFDGDTATIVSSIFGDGSMYTSTGGGILGGIDHENVRNASIRFVELSADFVDNMTLTTEFPLPTGDNVKFYLITPNGVYTTDEVDSDTLAGKGHELSPLFYAGNDVITELRKVSGN